MRGEKKKKKEKAPQIVKAFPFLQLFIRGGLVFFLVYDKKKKKQTKNAEKINI